MPKIKSFKAILPQAKLAGRIATDLEDLTIIRAKEIAEKNPESFTHLLVPKIEKYSLRGSKKEITFKKINDNFEEFLEKNILQIDIEPSIYIYKQTNNNKSYVGFWTISSIDDYLNNEIKKHELTRVNRENGLIEYLQQTGLDANPVLITYTSNDILDNIIADIINTNPLLDFNLKNKRHQIWQINTTHQIKTIVDEFANMKNTYIADGHHRAAAASRFGIERRKQNLNHNALEEFNFFSSVYISNQQLSILPFHRLLKLNAENKKKNILKFLKENFIINEVNRNLLMPSSKHQIGLYYEHKSYILDLTNRIKNNVLHDLDVSLLQNYILKPLFNIINPREDEQIQFVGGNMKIDKILNDVENEIFDIAFFVFPVLINDLMRIADIKETMPPKSTWFEPKFPAGLITHLID